MNCIFCPNFHTNLLCGLTRPIINYFSKSIGDRIGSSPWSVVRLRFVRQQLFGSARTQFGCLGFQ